jgi:hypothetical protein
MTFIVAKKGTRKSNPQVNISESAKTITFSAGFFRTYNIDLNKTTHLRLAYDASAKEIAIEFSHVDKENDEYLKLSQAQTKTSASCSIIPILSTFSVLIKEISGIYKESAISGPVKIGGFAESGFILKIRNREV